MAHPYPPIRHDDGTVTLWHPESPGMRVRVPVGLFRRLGLNRSPFATCGQVIRHHRRLRKDYLRHARER